MRICVQTVGTIFELLGSFKSVARVNRNLDVLARVKDNRAHYVICHFVALRAVAEAFARFSRFADMALDGMSTATAQVVFRLGA